MVSKGTVFGVGVNDIPSKNQEKKIRSLWRGMLRRCYSQGYKNKNPTYSECSIYHKWLFYSEFEKWVKDREYEGMELDKDILVPNNKVYHPDFCILVPHKVNTFINDRSKNGMLAGVSWCKQTEKYTARVSNPFTGVREGLGRSSCQHTLHRKWKKRKYELSLMLAEKYNLPDKVKDAISNRYL